MAQNAILSYAEMRNNRLLAPGDNELVKVVWHFMGLGGVEFTFLAAPGGICGYGCISMGLYLGGQTFYMIPSVTCVAADGGLVLHGGYWTVQCAPEGGAGECEHWGCSTRCSGRCAFHP